MGDSWEHGINYIVVCFVPGGDGRWYGQIIGNAPTREFAEDILARAKHNPRHRYRIGEVSYG